MPRITNVGPLATAMPIPKPLRSFWNAFAEATGAADDSRFVDAFAFGDNEALANELAALVLSGAKRATTSAVWPYEAEGTRMPAAGDLSIVTDWAGKPLCVIETTGVLITPFNQVSADFAAAEGEGDGSLDHWRESHRAYFTRECRSAGRAFTDDLRVCCERFKVVYPMSTSQDT
jgi:uncharacterized protein YhfF